MISSFRIAVGPNENCDDTLQCFCSPLRTIKINCTYLASFIILLVSRSNTDF